MTTSGPQGSGQVKKAKEANVHDTNGFELYNNEATQRLAAWKLDVELCLPLKLCNHSNYVR
ncbi:MAG: hypothetical protein ACXVB0_21940 [Mucilaginibacter sp.]